MFRFLKENSSVIAKMMIYQFGMTVFGLLLNSAASVANNSALVVGFSIFSIVFYLFLLYTAMWDIGARDKIRIEGKRLTPRPMYGALTSLCANIPNFLLALISLIGFIVIGMNTTSAASPEWAANMYAVTQLIGMYLNSAYLGVCETLNVSIYPFTLAVITLPSVLASFAGYLLGTKEKFPIISEKRRNDY